MNSKKIISVLRIGNSSEYVTLACSMHFVSIVLSDIHLLTKQVLLLVTLTAPTRKATTVSAN